MDQRRTALGIACVTLLLVGAWRMGWFGGDSAEIAQIKKIAAQPVTDESGKQMRDVLRQQFEQIAPEERAGYFERVAPILIPLAARQFEVQYDAFMAMTPEEQRRELDKRIDDMEKRGRPGGGQAGAGGGRPGGGGQDPKRADEFRKKMLAYTTPAQRSKFENGIRMFNDRRKQRGLEPVNPGRGRM